MHMTQSRRTSRAAVSAIATAAAVLLFAPGTPTAQGDLPVPFKVGETLTFDVSWTSFVTAGTATMSVKERRSMGGGKNAYYLVAEGMPSSMLSKLYSLYYKAESFLDTRTLLPAMATVYSDEGGRKRHKTTTFKSNNTVQYQIKTTTTANSTVTVGARAQDPLGAIYVLRALPLKAGFNVSIPMTDSGKAYTMRVKALGQENVKTGIGTLPAWKLTLQLIDAAGKAAEDGAMTIWISNDARKLPLKLMAGLTVGSFQLTLARAVG
jgi:hypothetical protein